MEQDYLTAAEAASLLDVSPTHIRRLVDAGDIPGTWESQTGECCIPRSAVLRLKVQRAREEADTREPTARATAEAGGYGKPDPHAPAPRIEV